MFEKGYIQNLCKVQSKGQTKRNVWGVDLNTVWIPFFTATNAVGDTAIPHDALGQPLRLAYAKDGSVKFSKAGKPVIRVAKDISQMVGSVKANFVAGLMSYTNEVYAHNTEAVKAEIEANVEAGKPIAESDNANLIEAIAKMTEQTEAEAQTEAQTEARELVPA